MIKLFTTKPIPLPPALRNPFTEDPYYEPYFRLVVLHEETPMDAIALTLKHYPKSQLADRFRVPERHTFLKILRRIDGTKIRGLDSVSFTIRDFLEKHDGNSL